MLITNAVLDPLTINGAQEEGAAGSSPPNEAFCPLIANLIVQSKSFYISGSLISLADAAFQDRCSMQLTIMMSDRANDIGSLDSACSGMTCDAKRIVCVALGNLIGFPDAFCDVPLGLSYRNFEEDSKPCDKLFSHDAHKGGIPGRTPLACGILQGDYAFGNLLVAAGTKSAEHIRCVASGFSALQVVCFQLYTVTVGAAVRQIRAYVRRCLRILG